MRRRKVWQLVSMLFSVKNMPNLVGHSDDLGYFFLHCTSAVHRGPQSCRHLRCSTSMYSVRVRTSLSKALRKGSLRAERESWRKWQGYLKAIRLQYPVVCLEREEDASLFVRISAAVRIRYARLCELFCKALCMVYCRVYHM